MERESRITPADNKNATHLALHLRSSCLLPSSLSPLAAASTALHIHRLFNHHILSAMRHPVTVSVREIVLTAYMPTVMLSS